MVTIKISPEFKRQLKPLAKKYRSMKSDYNSLLALLQDNPEAGVDLGNGIHKVRLAITSKGKGKSGGARVITYVVQQIGDETVVNLLTIYDKSEISNLSDQYIQSLADEVK